MVCQVFLLVMLYCLLIEGMLCCVGVALLQGSELDSDCDVLQGGGVCGSCRGVIGVAYFPLQLYSLK